MTDPTRAPADQVTRFPDCPEFALVTGSAFMQLGGSLTTGSDGKRYSFRPECHPNGLPQMEGARPWEQFHSDAEWQGAMKLASYWLTRLSERDKDLLFTMASTVSTGDGFDFRDHLSR